MPRAHQLQALGPELEVLQLFRRLQGLLQGALRIGILCQEELEHPPSTQEPDLQRARGGPGPEHLIQLFESLPPFADGVQVQGLPQGDLAGLRGIAELVCKLTQVAELFELLIFFTQASPDLFTQEVAGKPLGGCGADLQGAVKPGGRLPEPTPAQGTAP